MLKHPRDRLKNKEEQIARGNVSALMDGKFNFDPKKILNKVLLFDIKKVNEEIIMDKIIQALNDPGNDEFYIKNPTGSPLIYSAPQDKEHGKKSEPSSRDTFFIKKIKK